MKTFGDREMGIIMAGVIVAAIFGTYFLVQGVSVSNYVSTSSAQVLGHVTVKVLDENGNVKAYRQSDNAIVQNGFNILAYNLFNGVNLTAASNVNTIGIGTSGTAPAWNDVGITENASCTNQTASWTSPGATVSGSNATITISGTATFGPSAACGGGTVYQEAGVFNHISTGSMFARNTYTSVTLQNTDSLQINWDFTFTDT